MRQNVLLVRQDGELLVGRLDSRERRKEIGILQFAQAYEESLEDGFDFAGQVRVPVFDRGQRRWRRQLVDDCGFPVGCVFLNIDDNVVRQVFAFC